MEKITRCPICNSDKQIHFLDCIDYTVSRETFSIVECSECGLKITSPRPVLSDLSKYYKAEEYISHTDTNKGIINKIYKIVRNYTLLKKLQLVVRATKNQKGNILDIGCGTGSFLSVMKKAGWNTLGLEPDPEARKIAKETNQIDAHDISDLFLLNRQFNAISMWHVLEHVSEFNSYLSKIHSLLTDNGKVIIAVPNPTSYDALKYSSFWAAYDVPRHLWHFSPSSIEKLFKSHNFKLDSCLPMVFDSFYVSMLSEKYKGSGLLGLFKAFWIGLISNIKAAKTGRTYSSQIYIFSKIK